MDIEGGVTGNINDAMAAGVEEAAVICPFMTPAYQASRSCKKELSYADTREVVVVPLMVTDNWEASEWLGLVTAGLLWVDFRNAEENEEQFDLCVRSLEEEIMFNVGHLLDTEEAPKEEVDQPEPAKPRLKAKPGRGFRHAHTKLYIQESSEQITEPAEDSRGSVELSETPGDHSYWEEIKVTGCKYYRNAVTGRYLGFDSSRDELHSEPRPSEAGEWLLLVDQTDQSHRRAVVIKNKQSGRFLAVRDGSFTGLASHNQDCRWYLE
ncbi:uncharacterized protein LOC115390988 isoform X2 [Salarias fasciatus]|nr:uncharacterized protein LOC115390988 isoform X2 [Salarias fasciatus]